MPSPSSMINHFSTTQGYNEFQEAPADAKFAIYKLTLREIGNLLKKYLLEFPKNSLNDITIALNEIDNGFQELLTEKIKKEHANDIRAILEKRMLFNAQINLIDAYNKIDTKSRKYTGSFLNGRLLINQINELLMDPEEDP